MRVIVVKNRSEYICKGKEAIKTVKCESTMILIAKLEATYVYQKHDVRATRNGVEILSCSKILTHVCDEG